MSSKNFRVKIAGEGSMCFIPVPFDPVPVFRYGGARRS